MDNQSLTETKIGKTLMRIRVRPNSQKFSIILNEEFIEVQVKAPPTKGKANAEVLKNFSKIFGVSSKNIVIVRGSTSQDKVIEIPLSKDSVRAIIEKL